MIYKHFLLRGYCLAGNFYINALFSFKVEENLVDVKLEFLNEFNPCWISDGVFKLRGNYCEGLFRSGSLLNSKLVLHCRIAFAL